MHTFKAAMPDDALLTYLCSPSATQQHFCTDAFFLFQKKEK